MRYQSIKRIAILGLAITGLAALPLARADIMPGLTLPPWDDDRPLGHYVSPDYHAIYQLGGGNFLELGTILHYGWDSTITPPTSSGSASDTFHSYMDISGIYFDGVQVSGPITSNGVPTTTVNITYVSGTPTTALYYNTEMTALILDPIVIPGYGTALIRESPTLASHGQTTVTAINGGTGGYRVDSFFDVYTELSLDGGVDWIPSDSSVHMVYECPEPASITLGLLGSGLALMYRRGRRA